MEHGAHYMPVAPSPPRLTRASSSSLSYLQYAEVLSLPDEIKALIEEYNDAADRGRSIQKDCGDVYTTCDFSVKQIMEKYSHNEI